MPPASLLKEPVAEVASIRRPHGVLGRRRAVEVGLVAICILVWFTYSGSQSPWMRLNLPGGIHGGNPASGYTSLYNGDFYHKENFYALQHIDLLKGNYENFRDRIGFCDRRMFYGIVGNVLMLLFNSYHALRLLNLFAFLLCAHFVRRMTEQLFADRDQGLLASALFAISTLATVHVGDVSPHFVAFAFYYGWGLMMVRLADRPEPVTARESLGHAALLGLWSLTYTSFAYGLVIYLVILAWRKEWRNLVAPVAACVLLPQLQLLVVRQLGFGHAADVEKLLATRGLSMHFENFRQGPLGYSLFLVVEFVNYLVNDNPLNVLIGLAVLFQLKHRGKWVLYLLYFAPIAVVYPFIGTTTARGYVVGGNTIVLFPVVAHGVMNAAHWLQQRIGTLAGRGLVTAVLLVQLTWGQGSLFGWLFPTGAYAMGIAKHSPILLPTQFVPMTGDITHKPRLHGGNETAAAAMGFESDFGVQPVFPRRRQNPFRGHEAVRQILAGLAVQLPVLLCLAGIVVFLRPMWWRRWMTAGLVVLMPASLLFGAAEGIDPEAYLKFEDRIEVREGESFVVRMPLSPEFRELLEQAAAENSTAVIAIQYRAVNPRASQPAELKVFEHTTNESQLTVPLADLLADIGHHGGVVEFTLTPQAGSGGLLVRSWQRNRPDQGRTVEIVSMTGERRTIEWFPSLEIRVLRGENNYPLKSLITRWDLTRPVGYLLVGF